ncbi:hypothetical protein [Micromonospora parathelypteridis]|uniref:Uncharacterized protein n=1 Tax=Micromonospora parathelypteridis TaxID=1839617 RepID=A0A840VL37_9ACTN|nr:hypothetical protein [Micromonospora parathelypteridis]MBB5477683.1 hypothetical protein [Micromonospora parathelypteridis]GGO11123.1 hypothetical protein GCM10011576_19230 [Micromonospora parathelypteridis]
MSDLDPLLRERFAAYRSDVTARVVGPGPEQTRHTLRRRRRTTAVALAVAAVTLVFAPVIANAALREDRNPPLPAESVDPTAPPTSVPTPTVTEPPNASATPTQTPPDPISRTQLLAARLDLPVWPPVTPETCTTSKVRLRTMSNEGSVPVPVLADVPVGHADLDGDGVDEIVAVIACRFAEALAKQVVAFDRDSSGQIVTLGRVVRTTDGVEDILGLKVTAAGSIEVRVADLQPCCSTPAYWKQEQLRTYRWEGSRFTQTDGPTKFGKDPRLTDLRLTMTYELGAFVDNDARQYLTTVLTVKNAGPRDVERISFDGLGLGDPTGGDWSKCGPPPPKEPNDSACLLPGIPVGESRRYTFEELIPGGARQEYMDPQNIVVSHWDRQDRTWRDLTPDDNKVTLDLS